MKEACTRIIGISIIAAILFAPYTALAQTYQTFNPNATLQTNGNTFGGIRFSGVGGAIASCTNFGGSVTKLTNKAVDGIGTLFSSKKIGKAGATGSGGTDTAGPRQQIADQLGVGSAAGPTQVPVTDSAAEEQLAKTTKREECLDGVAYAVAKSLLQQVTEKVVSMVNTGNFGNPYYVRDLPSYLRTISDKKTAQFLDRIPQDDPIFGNAIRSLVAEEVTGVSDGLLSKTMNTPQGQAYQRFQEDFTQGGWEAFLDPENSPINSIFNAANKLGNSISEEQDDVKAQLQRNGGFLDMRRCVEYANTTTNNNGGPSQDTTGATDEEPECLTWETVTPGSVISAQINAVTTSPIRVLENSDKMSNNIDQIFGSIFDNMLTWLYSQGLGSLRGRAGSNAFTLGSTTPNIILGSNGQPINSTAAQNIIGYTQSGSGVNSAEFDVSRPQQIRTVLQVQYDYLNRALDSQIAEQRLIPVLGALDYCIPGPNPTWQDGLAENIQSYAGSLQVEDTNGSGSGTGGTIGTAAGAIAGSFIPVIGTAIGAGIGNVIGSLVGGLIDNGKPHAILTTNLSLYDKVTDGPILIRNTKWGEKNRSPGAVFDNMKKRLQEVMDVYQKNYTKDAITSAFLSVDTANADYVKGFVDSAFSETSKLPQYDQAIGSIDSDYTTQIANTKDAIKELEAIQSETNQIIATAKARYVQQQAAAGTPVNTTCLDKAYSINATPITPVARVESDTPSPYLNQSLQGATYFYSHL